MEQFYILDGLKTKIEMEQVLQFIDCTCDSPVYEEFVEEYQEIQDEIASLIKPVGILGFGKLTQATATEKYREGTKVLYAVTSVGDGASKESTKAFGEGNYVRGMLMDAIADVSLFSLEEALQEKVREICATNKVGIEKRLEAPQDIPMEVQKEAWENLRLKERLGINISSGFMLDPVKSSCQVFVLTDDVNIFKAQHDCRNCSNVTCKLRKIPEAEITVCRKGQERRFFLKEKESLMDGLLREGFYISAVCGGKGRCGKCKVRVLQGRAGISTEDERFFSKEELDAGWRLSCLLTPKEDLTISFELNDEAEFEAVSDFNGAGKNAPLGNHGTENTIAIDIGTTTIAFQLLEEDGAVAGTMTSINNQRKYGADVISRIQLSVDGKRDSLRECIRKDLQEGITSLLTSCERSLEVIGRVVIACNTTMSHLLMGYPCDSLGLYPFTPVNIDLIQGSVREMIGLESDAQVMILPGISTFVGGDIVSGLYACEFEKNEEICLLVDLGTNGEMALGNCQKLLVTSTAAGPAFEGGNLTWGMGSVAGAICSVELQSISKQQTFGEDNALKFAEETQSSSDVQYHSVCGDFVVNTKTIRDKKPLGICGTGVVESIAELLEEQVIDEMGLLEEDYFEEGFPLGSTEAGEKIVLTQKDIRELQLAKAAIRAGIETLLLRYGVSKEQVSKVYLAGGFGYRLDVDKAMAIGMLPREFSGKIHAVGNSALAGAARFLHDGQGEAALKKLVAISSEIGLSMDREFNEFYMEHMMFE